MTTTDNAQTKVHGRGIDFTIEVSNQGWYWAGLGDYQLCESYGGFANPRQAVKSAQKCLAEFEQRGMKNAE